MCGIVGVISSSKTTLNNIGAATSTLSKRGPDHQNTMMWSQLAFGHARLSIIDTSEHANQPLSDASGRYTIVFNGEIYNYKELKKGLIQKGVTFLTNSDTEVLLQLFIQYGEGCLEQLNGFFSFAIYDKLSDSLFIARDRIGIKPLLYYHDQQRFIFASELKALFQFDINKNLDGVSLFNYFQFNYIPTNNSILSGVTKVKPGHFIFIEKIDDVIKGKATIEQKKYYEVPFQEGTYTFNSYEQAQDELYNLLEDSVQKRLVADVPVGAYLSGGVDSSIISLLAKRHQSNLCTFSIGYKDEPYFDETKYANEVAKSIGSDHYVFALKNEALYENLNAVLDYIDEPFADSSAIAVYMLSKYTRGHVKVALSGDGADEMFSGYNKHMAEYKVRTPRVKESIAKWGYPLWKRIPTSRNSKIANINRQLLKFSEGARLNENERYWKWASILDEESVKRMLNGKGGGLFNFNEETYLTRKNDLLKNITPIGSMNEVLYTDMGMVLTNDMLRKVDMMSMANGLEVRTPFLDHRLVNFAFSLPPEYKINAGMKKRILQDTYRGDLPDLIYNRPKHGFEVPLLGWFKNEMRSTIENDLLNDDFIRDQGIFSPDAVKQIKKRLFSTNPGDTPATVWALIVFNAWWKRYFCA